MGDLIVTPHAPGPRPTETSSGSRTEDSKDFEVSLKGELSPQIPAGQYPAVFVRAEPDWPFGRPVIILWFEILPDGSSTTDLTTGIRLPLRCPLSKKGMVAPSSNYARAWQIAAGRRPTRKDRMSVTVFKHRLLRVQVRTVTTDHHQQPLPPANYYSVVDRLLGGSAEEL